MKKHVGEKTNEVILESISDGVFTVDHNWRIMSFNRAAENITGIQREEAIGRYCWEVFRSNLCEGDCALKRTMKEGKPFVSSSTYIINSEKKRVPIAVSTSVLKDEKGEILGGVETFRDHSLVEALRKDIYSRYGFGEMLSRSKSMQDIFAILKQVAESGSTVLIEGETGTGKEVMARTIHENSKRKEGPFVAINCGALPDSLLESELFGYKAGAFTGAEKDKEGLFGSADNGTIFLDEIGETSSAFQIRLLRVLEEKEYQPLGDVNKYPYSARIITATNRKLANMVERKEFRKDLYYRINIVKLTLPPLRERLEDLPLLLDKFVTKLNRIQSKAISGFTESSLTVLLRHKYPGNIRELENIVEHAFILCTGGEIELKHLPDNINCSLKIDDRIEELPNVLENKQVTLTQVVQDQEAEILLSELKRNGYNRLATARALGMHKSTLFRKIKKFNISLPPIDGRSIK